MPMRRYLTQKLKRKYIYRSSITGRIVSRLYALTHPTTTTKERIK